jgi:hypothetical protein
MIMCKAKNPFIEEYLASPPPLAPMRNTQKKQFTPLGYPMNSKENIAFAIVILDCGNLETFKFGPFKPIGFSYTRWQ